MLTKEQIKERIMAEYFLSENRYNELDKQGLIPDAVDSKAQKKMEELLARELKEDEADTYTDDEIFFLGSMDLERLNEKSSTAAFLYCECF